MPSLLSWWRAGGFAVAGGEQGVAVADGPLGEVECGGSMLRSSSTVVVVTSAYPCALVVWRTTDC